MQTWDLWYPNAASQGLPFARARIDPAAVVLVHALPDMIRVELRDDDGRLLARGDQLERTGDRPMSRLSVPGERIEREDVWPGPEDAGRVVILPGGEAGELRAWWNAPDGSEWRWSVEFYNHR